MTLKAPDDQSIHILLIEEDPREVRHIQQALAEKNGDATHFKLYHAPRMEESLHVLNDEAIDVILLDQDGRGTEMLMRLRAKISEVPVVVLTEMSDGKASQMVTLGAQDYIVKDQVNHTLLSRTLLHAVERHKIHREHLMLANELRRANVRMEKLVYSDYLTGLMNRRGLQEALSREVQRSMRGQEELLALILDLDNFKRINDTLGYAVGDIVLREIAKTIAMAVRVTDYVTRIGGDEFLVLMPDTRFAEGARTAEKIRRALEEAAMPLAMGSSFKITASLGLLRVPPGTLSIDELFAQTHFVLQKSKKMGKNRISYAPESDLENCGKEDVSNILSSLRHGKHYQVVKQPIFDLAKHDLVGYEFLSRFTVPGLEMPDEFFRVSLENNILTTVDSQCLKNCIHYGTKLPSQMTRHVNIFPSTLIDIPVRNLIELFDKSRMGGRYCVEISEQQIIGDPSYLVEPINALRSAGMSIAIDDVGFGRSSLESLILLEPDVVKIDKKWVNGIAGNGASERSLRRLQKVAAALGSVLVAEGIETEEDLALLVTLGVPYGQGYYLGRPA